LQPVQTTRIGCGKTTLLRIIARLEFADRGQIPLEGDDVSVRSRNIRVFQNNEK